MANMFDREKFRALVREAIGARTQKAFAKTAGLSPYHLTRLLKNEDVITPEKRTLKKIAAASEGRVAEIQLLSACGYETLEYPETALDGKEGARAIAMKLADGIRRACSHPVKYSSVRTALEAVALACNPYVTHFRLDEEQDFEKSGKNNAENMVCCTASWTSGKMQYDYTLSFIVYYCNTVKGGCILCDAAFDLTTLNEDGHKATTRFLFEESEKGDVQYTDYPIVFSYKEHVPGEAEKRLLAAIFGEIVDE